MPTVLAILADAFAEIAFITPVDRLRRASATVPMATLETSAASSLPPATDAPAVPAAPPPYDCLFLPGGPGVKHLRADPPVRTLVLRHHAAGRWLAAICAAPSLLQESGLLTGRRSTPHILVADERPDRLPAARVVVAGHVLTSRGAGTSLDFAQRLVEQLFGAAKAQDVARSVCA